MGVRINVERKSVEVEWDAVDDPARVVLYGQGEAGDWHNTSEMDNDGFGALSYPKGFVGESLIEVRGTDGVVVDSGTIEVGDSD